jgi:hypothetical protein
MRIAWRRHRGRGLVAALALAAFGVHALIPEGFMPGGGPLSIRICPDGFPTELLSHDARHHHDGNPAHHERCVFGSAGPGGPLASFSALADASAASQAVATDGLSVALGIRLVYLPQPRAPPRLADLTSNS